MSAALSTGTPCRREACEVVDVDSLARMKTREVPRDEGEGAGSEGRRAGHSDEHLSAGEAGISPRSEH
jgi:hypothetical protein